MGDRFFRKEFGKSESQKSKKSENSQDWPDLNPEPIFLDFGTIVMVKKTARTRLNTSRDPETLYKMFFLHILVIDYIIFNIIFNITGSSRVIPMGFIVRVTMG